jgi:hypothetical protein
MINYAPPLPFLPRGIERGDDLLALGGLIPDLNLFPGSRNSQT